MNECLLQGDFSQNYGMIAQDSTQSSFFNPPSQATIHTFLALLNIDGKITNHSICVISNYMNHNTVAVFSFLQVVINHIKTLCPQLTKITHFTDGAASQYKNFKNFLNLVYHQDDFGLKGEWHFFATSHGKGPCDGIGGTLKRLARRASLQSRTGGAVIQTPQSLFEWCNTHVENIKTFLVSHDDVLKNELFLEERFKLGKRIPGTQSFHSFIPIDGNRIQARQLSISEEAKIFVVKKEEQISLGEIDFNDCVVGGIIACVYDENGFWYLGEITELRPSNSDLKIQFFKPDGATSVAQGFMH